MSADDTQSIQWHDAAAFEIHKDFKFTVELLCHLDEGIIRSVSIKQKVSTRSSTEAELVGFDDIISKVLWKKLFIVEAQVHRCT